jgi:hypothetical protein
MDNQPRPRRAHLGFAIVMIAMGVVLLIMIRRPDFDPWTAIGRYWPLILIFLGLGQILDRMLNRNNAQTGGGGGNFVSGSAIALLVLIGFFALVARGRHPFRISDHVSGSSGSDHTSQTVEKEGATSVFAKIEMPAGELTIDGGATQLLDASFDYSDDMQKPEVSYDVSGTTGRLDIKQHDRSGINIGPTRDDWNLKFDDTPMDLEINMGAGNGELNFQHVDLTRLKIDAGVGNFKVYLTGDRKKDLQADLQGGVGNATIYLPRDVGVQVRAEGGIGSVSTEGLHKEGGRYVNDAFGKSPVTIHLNVEGGIGSIRLIQE